MTEKNTKEKAQHQPRPKSSKLYLSIKSSSQKKPVHWNAGPDAPIDDLDVSQRILRTLFEGATEGIAVVAVDSLQFKYTNPALCKILGYSKAASNSLRLQDILSDRHFDLMSKEFETQKSSQRKFAKNIRCLRKDGSELYVNINSTRVFMDGRECHVAFFQDLSQSVRAEKALKESEEKYRNILESIEEGYFEVDLAGRFTFFNDSICKILGYPAQELMDQSNREYTSPQTARKMYKIFNKVFNTGRPAKIEEYEIFTRDGSKRFLEVSASLMRDSNQKPIGFRGLCRDVTERLLAEKEKERIASQVQHVQKMEAIGTLAGGIAHDFNNLLMGFQGNLSLMLMDMNPDHPYHEYLKNMESYVLRGSDLTKQILGFARGGKYEVKSTDLNSLVAKSADMFSRTKKEISIHKRFQDNLWLVEVDQGQIEQVLLNLFVNAWQAMPGGGDLFLITENAELDDNYEKPYAIAPGKYVRITVQDTGIGIEKATQERIFEPFFTTKGMGGGTGLGLASAYGIIKNHNGIINVYSEVNHGATFKIYLPAYDKTIAKTRPPAETILKGNETILLIDDEVMVMDVGHEMLENLGYKVYVADGGSKALKLMKHFRDEIDLVILDMIMPDMSGSQTFDMIKKISPDVKVLLSSGYSIDGLAGEIMKRGCNGFIQKPFSLKKISKKIREILDQ